MDRFYYRATVDEAERIIKTEKIEHTRHGGKFNANSGPYFSVTPTIPQYSWLNSVWPNPAGTVLFEFTSPLTENKDHSTTSYARLIGAEEARSLAAHILTLDAGPSGEKVGTIVAPQQNGLQLKGVTNANLLSRGAQDKIAKMTAKFADGYISIA